MTTSDKKNSVTVERRRHARISGDLESAVKVDLVMENGTAHAAVPIDISTGGVALRWSPENALVLQVGQRVELRIQPVTADAPVTVEAVVRWTGIDDDGSVRYGMEFENLFKIFEDVIPALWQLCHALHERRRVPPS
jgi:c-di-GMP-binding flagellar brake protein YcgR